MPFGIAAAGIGAAASLGGAMMQSNATSKAAGAASQDQRIAYLMADAYNKPYRDAGDAALAQLTGLTGLHGDADREFAFSRFRTDPGYQFAVDEGLRAIDSGAASSHLLRSGATLKAEQARGMGLADQQFGQYVNRLFGLSQMGQSAANQQATNTLNTGTNMANIALGQGAAESSIYGNAAKGIGTVANDLLNNKSFQGLFSGGGSGVVGNPYTPSIYGVPSPY